MPNNLIAPGCQLSHDSKVGSVKNLQDNLLKDKDTVCRHASHAVQAMVAKKPELFQKCLLKLDNDNVADMFDDKPVKERQAKNLEPDTIEYLVKVNPLRFLGEWQHDVSSSQFGGYASSLAAAERRRDARRSATNVHQNNHA